MDNYRFTFACSSTGSSKGSFIEPDVSLASSPSLIHPEPHVPALTTISQT